MVKMFSQGRATRDHIYLNGPDTFYREAGGCTRETHRGFDQLIKAQIEANSSWWGAGWTVRWFALLIQEHAAVSLLRILKGDTLKYAKKMTCLWHLTVKKIRKNGKITAGVRPEKTKNYIYIEWNVHVLHPICTFAVHFCNYTFLPHLKNVCIFGISKCFPCSFHVRNGIFCNIFKYNMLSWSFIDSRCRPTYITFSCSYLPRHNSLKIDVCLVIWDFGMGIRVWTVIFQ